MTAPVCIVILTGYVFLNEISHQYRISKKLWTCDYLAPYAEHLIQGDSQVVTDKDIQTTGRRTVSPKRKSARRYQRNWPDFDTAPVFTIAEVGHFGRWSMSTTRRRIADGSLETVAVAGVLRVTGPSARKLLTGGK